ncbi:MAG: tRNA (N6-threonylcarbamoyladenosine(37)-N6)-methyltransferase TrmO [Bdellovibrio sp.]
MATSKIEMNPIGIFHSNQVQPYEAGRQPDEFHAEGVIELFSGQNFEQALVGLEGCERIWVLFYFHHNPHWNPMVLPPRGRDKKVGVFATRSPYRPNSIGMSCVKVKQINKLKIHVEGADILNESPILDIKPYVAYADSFPGVEPIWLQDSIKHKVLFSTEALTQLQWLEDNGVNQFKNFLLHQLEYEPANSKKKRVKKLENSANEFVIAYRTWRAHFTITTANNTVEIKNIFSGYSENDLKENSDPYLDKELHREFKTLFQTLPE